MEEGSAAGAYREIVGQCKGLFEGVTAGVAPHFGIELPVGLFSVGFRAADPILKIMMIAIGVEAKIRDLEPSALRPAAVAN